MFRTPTPSVNPRPGPVAARPARITSELAAARLALLAPIGHRHEVLNDVAHHITDAAARVTTPRRHATAPRRRLARPLPALRVVVCEPKPIRHEPSHHTASHASEP